MKTTLKNEKRVVCMSEMDAKAMIDVLQIIINTIESNEWELEDSKIDITNDLIDDDWIICDSNAFYKPPVSRGKKYKMEFYLKAR